MNRAEVIAAVVARIAYEDWHLELLPAETLRWHYRARDVYTGAEVVLAGRPLPLWHIADAALEREVVTTAFLGVKTILEHEARELFRLGETHPFAPHNRPFNGRMSNSTECVQPVEEPEG